MCDQKKIHAFLLDFALEPDVGGGCFVFSAIDDFDVDAVLDFLFSMKLKLTIEQSSVSYFEYKIK